MRYDENDNVNLKSGYEFYASDKVETRRTGYIPVLNH